MDLTQEQILEMTETIARAFGIHCERIKSHVYRVEMLSGEEESFHVFEPFASWDDAFMAVDTLEVGPMHITPVICNGIRSWRVGFGYSRNGWEPYAHDAIHQGQLTAFCLALHEAAKAKLEGYQNEDGN